MTRWISLVLLLFVIGVTGVVLYRVMANFILPLFLASVLTVIFRPIHLWIHDRCRQRANVSAACTTGAILLMVLLPLGGLSILAIREAFGAVGGNVLDRAERRISNLRRRVGLEMPFASIPLGQGNASSLEELDREMRVLPDHLPDKDQFTGETTLHLAEVQNGLDGLQQRLDDLWKLSEADNDQSDDSVAMTRVKSLRQALGDQPRARLHEIRDTIRLALAYANAGDAAFGPNEAAPSPTAPADSTPVPQDDPSPPGDATPLADAPENEELEAEIEVVDLNVPAPAPRDSVELRKRYNRVKASYEAFRIDILGGPMWAWATDLANPSAAQVDTLRSSVQRYLRSWLPSVAGQATALMGHLVFGLGIMGLALFYFFRDGPAIVRSLMRLSPLDDRYEQELLQEFETVSRAVVLATLLSALAQAGLASIAYFLARFDSVFLLTSLTLVLAMVPFVGAAAVWFPACLWLAFVEERYVAALVMGVYGFGVISMIDNIIKPLILHGQSKLHPLLALLSVLGGVQALGPIGILVGPMGVSFLQALLNILHRELQSLDRRGPVRVPA